MLFVCVRCRFCFLTETLGDEEAAKAEDMRAKLKSFSENVVGRIGELEKSACEDGLEDTTPP